ncbi:hypothetical protein [Yoonia vestfoldensis]|uniref:Uncharacterized protein n=1 Tax=Yoonia vestfoldensis TaxID=245188 RepID=A0A1Y0EI56_9RHOB|nr:hypothetical protein [Yoonia vestfoldensis]ARU02972.1 hypothetical protein LOKVESSMR4R_03706 [Yoonia vestfoldensis]
MPHYTAENPDHHGATVFLDGDEIDDVVECHDEEGWVVVFDRQPNGDLKLAGDLVIVHGEDGETSVHGSCIATIRHYGVVTVQLPAA